MAREFVIYADESVKQGRYYSNFYGGAMVQSGDLALVESELRQLFAEENLKSEVKWTKVSSGYLAKYVSLMDCL